MYALLQNPSGMALQISTIVSFVTAFAAAIQRFVGVLASYQLSFVLLLLTSAIVQIRFATALILFDLIAAFASGSFSKASIVCSIAIGIIKSMFVALLPKVFDDYQHVRIPRIPAAIRAVYNRLLLGHSLERLNLELHDSGLFNE